MTTVDLVVRNARLVLDHDIVSGGVAIDDGKIVSVSGDAALPPASKTLDAKGQVVIPGLVDPHMHLGIPDFEKDVKSETISAACGGVTTLVDFMMNVRPYALSFGANVRTYERNASVDVAFHAIILNNEQLAEIPVLYKLGVTSFKFFMAYRGPEALRKLGIEGVDDGFLYDSFRKIASLPQAVAMVHAENSELAYRIKNEIRSTGRSDLAAWSESRPNFCEEEAISRAIFLARRANCTLYIVHMSTREGVEVVRHSKSEGIRVFAETVPRYLALTKHDSAIGFYGKCAPPLRDYPDQDELWRGLADRTVDCVGSDHNALTKKEKGGDNPDIWESQAGTPDVETILPILLSEGVHKQRLSLQCLVNACCTMPSEIFGLKGKKGRIAVGYDGDLVIVDMKQEKRVTSDVLHSRTDYTQYEGKVLKGWPIVSIMRGNIIVEGGQFMGGTGLGRYVRRPVQSVEVSA